MTTIYYGERIQQAVDGNKTDVPFVTVSLDTETPNPEEVAITHRLLILGAIGAILVTETLEELYIPIQLDEINNVFLEEQWHSLRRSHPVKTVKFRDENDNTGYGKLAQELQKYRRAGLMIMKTDVGATAEIVEIELL
ncbi:hypothetical protein JA33_037 [Dickeya phage vB_DsoM_JA33]|uniref:Uncharacterized protein n=4 Tax=Salmondvirus TaxID=2733130 RepID=A0A384ZW26_9CAUD|nr:hypothetical protein HOU08_gp040 [Dickeya phage vB_DsoM_JA29]YP_009813482.1 hypothetical protein HOU32_gp037 [Dickeya phage vB_DsoM_JA11]AXG66442.1 hypothetical protein JA13_039 [Dickeya phage vB_DsoM_JA13]AXG67411.1 hypothetical protein JA33_037 [Dickeya phage vB_DsoM_JA33]AXG66766.1 hypothetical protein JA29_040 [Dickeya phage vB_DsoM_JA29]AYD79842.1 hypothetical protein JA11_037 [Dickeya phage vB_DsoM_JA11]